MCWGKGQVTIRKMRHPTVERKTQQYTFTCLTSIMCEKMETVFLNWEKYHAMILTSIVFCQQMLSNIMTDTLQISQSPKASTSLSHN